MSTFKQTQNHQFMYQKQIIWNFSTCSFMQISYFREILIKLSLKYISIMITKLCHFGTLRALFARQQSLIARNTVKKYDQFSTKKSFLPTHSEIRVGAQQTSIYRNTLKTQHLIQYQFLPEDQIIPVIDNEMDKSDQLACIRYKNQNILA